MIRIDSQYNIARNEDKLYLLRIDKWANPKNLYDSEDKEIGYCYKLCDKEEPYVYLTTNNYGEMKLRRLLPIVSGAICKKKEIHPWMDEDPYGRKVERGTYSYEVWDLSALFDILPISELEHTKGEWMDKYKLLNLYNNDK